MLFRRKRFDADLDEEMRLHREMRVQEQIERGVSAKEAHYAAHRRFGNDLLLREESRDMWGWNWLEHFLQDIQYGLRMLRKNPGFTAVAVLTLALGIGANTAIFSIVNAIFLRPLPFPNADRIYVVDRVGNEIGGSSISFPIYLAWAKEREKLFDRFALVAWWHDAVLTGRGEPERVPAKGASTELFSLLGVQPALGRNFLPEEGRPGGPNAVILSDSLWRSRFGSDTKILGQTITIDGQSSVVVGILPHGFELPIPGMRVAQLWQPIQVPLASNNPANGGLLCLGLLKRNVTPAQAAAALTPPLSVLEREFPKMFSSSERAHLEPLRSFLADRAGTAPWLLFGAVGLVLLLACANVANLTLVRSTGRAREIAIRAAIGASRARVVRQLATESVLLALLGGAVGVMGCYTSLSFILALVPGNLPHVGAFQMDRSVLIFALLLSVLTGVAFGLAPALAASRVDLSGSLSESNPRLGLSARGRFRSLLAASEVSISLVLLIGAALTLESFALLMRVRPGFDAKGLLTFSVLLSEEKYHEVANRRMFFEQAVGRIQSLPDVEQAALVNVVPLGGEMDLLFAIEGGPGQPDTAHGAFYRVISPGFFQTLRIPLLRGRVFSGFDDASGEPVAIINQEMARMFWPNQDPIGHRIWIGKPMGPEWAEPSPRGIVGVVGDIREASLASPPEPTMYIPYAQKPASWADFVIRTRQAPMASVAGIRDAMHSMDSEIPLGRMMTMEQVLSSSVTDWRFRTVLLALFGSLALFIAAIGIYGVISYSVAQRTHEIGVRIALGAVRRDVVKLVVGQGLKLALAGIAIGLVGAWALTRFLTSLLFGVKPTDPLTYVVVCLILTAVAVLASYLPARRATKVDPMVALRYE
jgi:predicted permease